MSIEIRPPTDDEWPAVAIADGRVFGSAFTAEEIEELRPLHDVKRFRVAFDGKQIACVAGSYTLNVTLPGSASVPMGGVTWVSTSVTHRRQGLMRRVIDAIHEDIDERGEPLATLYASEGSIYEHVGYGIASHLRVTSLNKRAATMRAEYRPAAGSVRYLDESEAADVMMTTWEKFRRVRVGEVNREQYECEHYVRFRSKPQGDMSPAAYLAHKDGYAIYRIEPHWNDGHPAHTMHVIELAALTPAAHAALWYTLLSVDLVAEIKSRNIPLDDPLPYLLENQRALRTVELNDAVWVNVLDVATAFSARTYRTDDRIVVEADGKRWAIEGGPSGATCTAVRSKPDLITSHGIFSSLLYGGILPSRLVAGRRMTARSDAALTRADIFFTTALLPHCQTNY